MIEELQVRILPWSCTCVLYRCVLKAKDAHAVQVVSKPVGFLPEEKPQVRVLDCDF